MVARWPAGREDWPIRTVREAYRFPLHEVFGGACQFRHQALEELVVGQLLRSGHGNWKVYAS